VVCTVVVVVLAISIFDMILNGGSLYCHVIVDHIREMLIIQSMRDIGFSRQARNSFSQDAPTAPSTTR